MKTRITLGLCVVLGAGSISVRAADNPAQAAARAALEYKMSQPDAWNPQSLTTITALTTPAVAATQPPVQPAGNVTATLSAKAATPQSAAASTSPMAAVIPRLLLLTVAFLTIVVLAMSFLVLKLIRQNSRAYEANQDSTSSRTWNV
jgi:hypothetical protein